MSRRIIIFHLSIWERIRRAEYGLAIVSATWRPNAAPGTNSRSKPTIHAQTISFPCIHFRRDARNEYFPGHSQPAAHQHMCKHTHMVGVRASVEKGCIGVCQGTRQPRAHTRTCHTACNHTTIRSCAHLPTNTCKQAIQPHMSADNMKQLQEGA